MTSHPLHRDLSGYGAHPPDAQWPHGARLAVSFVLAFEEGSELSFAEGDEQSESYLCETISASNVSGVRSLSAESIYEYGSRVGIWRLMRLLDERGIHATVLANGRAVELHPAPVRALAAAGHEIASHHYRWINYKTVPEDIEREHLRRSVAAIERVAGTRPVGIYAGRGSLVTRRLVVEEGGFLYDSDAYNDDLPYWVRVGERDHLVVPYSLDHNDFRFSVLPSWASGDDFFHYVRDGFDFLLRESAETPRMMSIGLHPRIGGRPARAAAIERILDHICSRPDVWICRRADIARHWRAHHPPRPQD